MSEQQLEAEIVARGLTKAPRVTPAALEAMIKTTELIKIGDSILLCILTLHNGLTVVGKNLGSVCPENYDEELGKKLAMRDARDQLWPLAGFMLAEDIHRGNRPLTEAQRELPDHVQQVLGNMFQYASRLQGITELFEGEHLAGIDPAEVADLSETADLLGKLVSVTQRRLDRAGV